MIESLGYVGFGVADADAWTRFATDVLGLMPATSPAGATRFRTDSMAWRIALEEGPDDIVYAGYELADAAMLETAKRTLADAGVAFEEADAALLRERGVTGLITCKDPDGLRVELYYGPTERQESPFTSPVGISGFVTAQQGLGHIVLGTKDIVASRVFYCDLLGFRLSDIIRMQVSPEHGLDLEFYHCNARHHTLALIPAPMPKRMHHFMLQANTLDEVGFALDRAAKAGAPIAQTLGRHTNDRMVSFYAQTPSGFEVEFGWGADEVDESTWRVSRHEKMSSWGHKRPSAANA